MHGEIYIFMVWVLGIREGVIVLLCWTNGVFFLLLSINVSELAAGFAKESTNIG